MLLFTTTSRVISPQYMVWLVGLAAVCLALRASRQTVPALLVLAATAVTLLEFPVWFAHVVASDALGVSLLVLRNGLLVAASVLACLRCGVPRCPRRPPRRPPGAPPGAAARSRALRADPDLHPAPPLEAAGPVSAPAGCARRGHAPRPPSSA